MHGDKYYIALDDGEKHLLIYCLNKLRTRQLKAGKGSSLVDEVLLKIINAKKKKFKINITEV